MRNHLYFPVALLADQHGFTKITDAIIDFDFVVEEFLESGDVEDFIRGGLRGVDDELLGVSKGGYFMEGGGGRGGGGGFKVIPSW